MRRSDLSKRTERLRRRIETLTAVSNTYWKTRRIVAGIGVAAAFVCFQFVSRDAGWIAVALFLLAFILIAKRHRLVRDSITAYQVWSRIKASQVARLGLDWDGIPGGADGSGSIDTPVESSHPFGRDLDLAGNRSLLRLLDTAMTREGSDRLRGWLLEPEPDPDLVIKRQRRVEELSGLAHFRERLQLCSALVTAESAGRLDSQALTEWIRKQAPAGSLLPRFLVLLALSAANITLVALNSAGLASAVWPLTLFAYLALMLNWQSHIAGAFQHAQRLESVLRRYGVVFGYLETGRYPRTKALLELCGPFYDKQSRPSIQLKRIERLSAALGLRTNAIVWGFLHLVIPWDYFFAHRLNRVKEDMAHLVPEWLERWHELEALNSLANFAYLNPEYAYPRVNAQSGAPHFRAQALGHPLIPPDHRIDNDFDLGGDARVAIMTGSNMSGKSTFLRTVGINLCLAYAGAPVAAAEFETSLFRIFTCIKVSDSVQDGLSYFYAEVKRLKALLELIENSGSRPVLFLIDEIFRGTNNREREIGSRSFIRYLAERSRSIGLAATHDLELVKLADQISGLANFHFREEVADGRMIFDYRLRSGPCPTTNALLIMQIEGLPVDGREH